MQGHPVISYNSCVSNCFNLVESLSTCEKMCSTSKSSTQIPISTTPKAVIDLETKPRPSLPKFTSSSSGTSGTSSTSKVPSKRPDNSIPEIPKLPTANSTESVSLKTIPHVATSNSKSSLSLKENSTLPTSPITQKSGLPASQPSIPNPNGGNSLFEPNFGKEPEVSVASSSTPPRPDSPINSQPQPVIVLNCTVFYSIEFFSKVLKKKNILICNSLLLFYLYQNISQDVQNDVLHFNY